MQAPAPPTLHGRTREVEALATLIDAARREQSGVLCLTGEPGIGKTALLDHAAALGAGLTVIRAQGAEAESDLAFAGLSQIARPLRRHIDALPRPQAEALRGALALGPPAVADRFAIAAAFLALLGQAAEERPLLLLVDDAHWLDGASSDALAFACRRLEAEGIAVLLASRALRGGALDGLPELALDGLDEQATAALLAEVSPHASDPSVVRQLQAGSLGNPLALVELAASLSEAQLGGRAPLDEPLPVGPRLEYVYRRQMERLPEGTQRALLVLAAADGRATGALSAALAEFGEPAAVLEAAEAAGLVAVDRGRVSFRHPLVRAACYHGASASERRKVHRLLAGTEDDEDTRAWHLAAAAFGADDGVAALLEATAIRARQRNAHAEAARAFERAGRLSTDAARAAERLSAAARELQAAGRLDAAVALLDEAEQGAASAQLRLEILRLRAAIEMWRGHPLQSHYLLTAEAKRIQERDPSTAADLYLEAIMPALLGGGPGDIRDASRNAAQLVGDDHPLVSLGLGAALIVDRREREASPFIQRAADFMEAADPLAVAHLLGPAAMGLALLGEHDRARTLVGRSLAAARARGVLGTLALALSMASIVDFWRGQWREAYADGTASLRLAESIGQATDLSLTWLLFVEAGMGRDEDCRAHAAEALASIERTGNIGMSCWVHAALGLLELGLGRHDAAVAALEQARRAVPPGAQPTGEWTADLAEAYLRAGQHEQAAAELEWLSAWSEDNQLPVGQALAARVRLLAATDGEIDRCYEEATCSFARVDVLFDRARTELYYGERLRRAKRLTEARTHLARALDAFERLGAVPWGERARAELRASGGSPRSPERPALAELTPRELQIALAIAGGATNREAAAQLLLSPKTVAFHLNNIYRKLTISSRVELAVMLANLAGGQATAGPP